MKDLLIFILDSIYSLNQTEFSIIGVNLGYEKPDGAQIQGTMGSELIESTDENLRRCNTERHQGDSMTDRDNNEPNEDKKEKLKKRQNKLLLKMKKKGGKYLNDKSALQLQGNQPSLEKSPSIIGGLV